MKIGTGERIGNKTIGLEKACQSGKIAARLFFGILYTLTEAIS